MGLSELFDTVEFNELIMIILTVIIAFSAYSQAKNTKKQAQLLKQSEERNRERHNPKIRMMLVDHIVQDDTNWISYVGFSITNASSFDVTIISLGLELEIPEDNDGPITLKTDFPHVTKFKDRELSDSTLPRRLKYGESLRILYDETGVVERLRAQGSDQPARVRPQCYDSLGNKHTMDSWITWKKGGVAYFDGPRPDYLTAEEAWKKRQISKRLSKRLLQSCRKKIRSLFDPQSRH